MHLREIREVWKNTPPRRPASQWHDPLKQIGRARSVWRARASSPLLLCESPCSTPRAHARLTGERVGSGAGSIPRLPHIQNAAVQRRASIAETHRRRAQTIEFNHQAAAPAGRATRGRTLAGEEEFRPAVGDTAVDEAPAEIVFMQVGPGPGASRMTCCPSLSRATTCGCQPSLNRHKRVFSVSPAQTSLCSSTAHRSAGVTVRAGPPAAWPRTAGSNGKPEVTAQNFSIALIFQQMRCHWSARPTPPARGILPLPAKLAAGTVRTRQRAPSTTIESFDQTTQFNQTFNLSSYL